MVEIKDGTRSVAKYPTGIAFITDSFKKFLEICIVIKIIGINILFSIEKGS
jgi:hypothetical protein